jgi:hypothetical protein
MSFVNESTPVTAVPELELFSKAPVQTSIESTFLEEIRPINQLNTGGHIEFNITNGNNEFIRLNETTLSIKFKVKLSKSDGSAIVASDWNSVSIVNNFLHSLWSQVDLLISNVQTTVSLHTYPFRCYNETILGSTDWSRKTHLKNVGFVADKMDEKDTPQASRQHYIKYKTGGTDLTIGRVCSLEGKLHLDLFFQPRVLLGGTPLKIRLVPNKSEFYFKTNDDKIIPRIEFLDIHLNVMKSRVSDELLLAHMRALSISSAKYPIVRSQVKTFTIDKGVTSRNLENVINGQLPRRIYLSFISNEAFGGSYTKNPFYYDSYNINSIACFVNGEQFPRRAYTPDFSSDDYTRELTELYRISGQLNNEVRMMIDRNTYDKGFTIFAFNLSQDLSDGYNSAGYNNITKSGVLRFEIQFAKQLETTINAIVHCEFDNLLSIPEDRSVYMDY